MNSSFLKPEDEGTELDEKQTYRTTYMFSATMPPAVERLARKYLRRSEAGVGGRGEQGCVVFGRGKSVRQCWQSTKKGFVRGVGQKKGRESKLPLPSPARKKE
jgi:hypothetical protein